MIPRSLRTAGAELSIAAALAAAAWWLYLPVLRLWWTHDDLYHLHLLLGSSRVWYFWDTAVYQAPPPKMLTPLLFFSLDLDRRLAGLHPAAFYAHHLISLSLAPAALYGVLRLWLARAWAALGGFVFLLGAPLSSLAMMLMVRHYIEVIPPAALAVAFWVLALRRPKREALLAAASAVCWLLAALEKEIAVPLILFLPLLPEGSLGGRLRRMAPHALALAVYLVLRFHLLGGPAQQYGLAVTPGDWARLALALPLKVAGEVRGLPTPASWLFLAALLAGLAVAASLSRGAALRVAAALGLSMAPVLPVSTQMEPRFVAAPWLVAAVILPFACAGLWARGPRLRRAAVALALLACAAGLKAHGEDWTVRYGEAARRSAEWRFFLTMPPGELLRQPVGLPGELGELHWLKEDVLGLPRGAGWFLDDLYLCLHPETGRVWGWEARSRRVVDVTAQIPGLRRRFCAAIRQTAPLRAEIRAADRSIAWDLGPYTEGRYGFVLGDGITAVEMPRSGGFDVRKPGPLALRVRYESPEGWVTYSPELRMDLAKERLFRWAR